MIIGQNIGVLCGEHNWLYTEVQKWDGTILVGHVINGNWAFHMNVKTGEGIIHTPGAIGRNRAGRLPTLDIFLKTFVDITKRLALWKINTSVGLLRCGA